MPKITKPDAVFLIAFLLTIFVPLYGLYPNSELIASGENRFLHPLPSRETAPGLSAYFKQVDAFWADHFGLRKQYLDLYGALAGRIFPEKFKHNSVRGKDGWFFLFAPETRSDMLGGRPLIEPAKEEWLAELRKINDWLRAQGIRFLFVIVPDKHRVYPEYLPAGALKPGSVGRWGDLKPFLAPLGESVVTDLTDTLLEAKKAGRPLFHRDDSHWNYIGALSAADAILKKSRALGIPAELKAGLSDLEPGIHSAMDLVSIDSDRSYERILMPSSRLRALCQVKDLNPPGLHGRINGYTCAGGSKRLLFLGDSFSDYVEPLLAPSFKESIFAMRSDTPLAELVRLYKPDLVIEQHVEREIGNRPMYRAP